MLAYVWVSVDDDPDAAPACLSDGLAYDWQALAPYLLEGVGLVPDGFELAGAAIAADGRLTAFPFVSNSMLSLGVAGTSEEVSALGAVLLEAGATNLWSGTPLGPNMRSAVALAGAPLVPAQQGWGSSPA